MKRHSCARLFTGRIPFSKVAGIVAQNRALHEAPPLATWLVVRQPDLNQRVRKNVECLFDFTQFKAVPKVFQVSAQHRQREEHCNGLVACFRIWYKLRPGDLLDRDKAECTFNEFLSTPRKDKPFLACPCVCNPRRRNERGILFTPKGKRYLESFRLWDRGRHCKRVLGDRVEKIQGGA